MIAVCRTEYYKQFYKHLTLKIFRQYCHEIKDRNMMVTLNRCLGTIIDAP